MEDYHAHKEEAAKALEQERAQLKKVAKQLADKNEKKDKKVNATESFIVEQTKHADRTLRAYVNADWPTAAEFLENAITQVDQLKKDFSTDGELGAVGGLVYLHTAFVILRETNTAEGYAFGTGGFTPAVEEAIVAYALHVPTEKGEEWTGFFKHVIGYPGFAAQAFVALVSGESGRNGFLPAAREQLEAMDMLAVEIGPRHARNVALVLAHKQAPPEDENAEGVEEDEEEDEEEEGGDTQHDGVSADDVWAGQVLQADERGEVKASHRRHHHHSHGTKKKKRKRHSSLRGDHSKRCCCCRGKEETSELLQGVGASQSESCEDACVGVRGPGAIYFDKTVPQGSCRSPWLDRPWTGKCVAKPKRK